MCLVGIFRACLFCVSSTAKLSSDIVQLLPGATTHGLYVCLSEHLFTISLCTFLRGINVNVWTLATFTRVSDQ